MPPDYSVTNFRAYLCDEPSGPAFGFFMQRQEGLEILSPKIPFRHLVAVWPELRQKPGVSCSEILHALFSNSVGVQLGVTHEQAGI